MLAWLTADKLIKQSHPFLAFAAAVILLSSSESSSASFDPPADCKSPLSIARIKGCTARLHANPRDVDAYILRGEAHRLSAQSNEAAGEYALAISDFTEAIRLAPDRVDAWFGRAQVYEAAEAFDHAIADLNEVLRRKPRFAVALYRRAVIYFRQQGDDRALLDLDAAAHLDPKLNYAFHLRGDIYRRKGDYARAIAEYTEEYRHDDPGPRNRRDRGIAYLLAGDNDHAIEDFDLVATDFLFVSLGRYGRGLARLRKGDVAGGTADIREALARNPAVVAEFAREGVAPPAGFAVQP